MKQGDQDPGTAGTYGVAQSNGTAIHVDKFRIESQCFTNCQGLGRKSFIGLNKPYLLQAQLCLLQRPGGRMDGARTHDGRVQAG